MEHNTEISGKGGSGAKWVKGAALLGAAAVISKLLGTLQKIPLQNVAGDGVYGIYSLVYPFYILILFLAVAGFPVAVSTFVSRRLSEGDNVGAVRVLRVSVVILSISGVAGFALLYFGAEWLAVLIGNDQTAPAIRSVSYALLFVPMMSALRGYFQGGNDMAPTAVSQVVEQFVRVGTMILVLIFMTVRHMEDQYVAAGATFGAVTGACAGMAVMLVYWARHKRSASAALQPRLTDGSGASASQRTLIKEPYLRLAGSLMKYAIPVCLGAIAVPVMNIVDTFTLPRLFREPGMSDMEAAAVFGVYNRGLPLVQMVAMLVSSIAVALVPAIAEAKARGDLRAVRLRTELSIRVTWMVGAASSVGLAVTALPVNWMLYEDGKGTGAIALLAFTAVFSTLNITSSGILQGLGVPGLAAIHMLIAAAVKVALNYILTPGMGINGAALAAVIAFGVAAILNIAAIIRTTGVPLPLSVYVWRTGIALAVMAGLVASWTTGVPLLLDGYIESERAIFTISALSGIALGAVSYMIVLLRMRGMRPEELQFVPGAEKKLLPMLRKLRII